MFKSLKNEKAKPAKSSDDRTRRAIEIFSQDLASIFNRAEQKKIAPPPPAVTDFDQRVLSLRARGRRRGKRYSWIGIASSLVILIILAFLTVVISRELSGINAKIDERKEMFEQVIKSREKTCESACCQDSLTIIKQNGYQKANYEGRCPADYLPRSLSCETSLVWCVPVIK